MPQMLSIKLNLYRTLRLLLKALVHPKMQILSVITQPMLFQHCKTFVHLQKTQSQPMREPQISSKKYLILFSEDERKFYWVGTTWGRLITHRIFIFGSTRPNTLTSLRIWQAVFSMNTNIHELQQVIIFKKPQIISFGAQQSDENL